MKKLTLSVAAFALAATSLTPAFAAPIAYSSLPSAQQALAQATCNLALPGNSPFIATPTSLDDTVTVGFEVSRVTVQNIPGGTELSRTPFLFDANSEHRNGQSPNIFGFYTTIITYSGGLLIQNVTTTDRHKVTFGCRITKTNGEIAPNGLQVPNDGTLFVNFDTNTSTTQTTVSAPNYTQSFSEDRVVCNSPLKNPGVWRAQNGYTAKVCSTTLYLSLGANPGTHSNSVPGLTPLRPDGPDHQESLPLDSLFTSSMPWDGVEGLDG